MLRLHPDDLKRDLEEEQKQGRFKPRNLTESDWLAEERRKMFPTDFAKKQEKKTKKSTYPTLAARRQGSRIAEELRWVLSKGNYY